MIRLLVRDHSESQLFIVPTRAAAREIAGLQPVFVTRDELYQCLHARIANPPRWLSPFDREAIAQSAAAEAERIVHDLTFQVRPGLVAEMLRFYDHLRRQGQQVERFEQLIEQALGADAAVIDRGTERMLRQTRFLARTFAGYESRVAACGACDEHQLRARLIAGGLASPVRHFIVTVPDWIADPDGLFVADFDLLARMPAVESIDIVATSGLLESGFHQRLHDWLPGLEEIDGCAVRPDAARLFDSRVAFVQGKPALVVPQGASPEQLWFVHRDREDELLAVARGCNESPIRVGVVYKRPLPYLYLAPGVFGAAGVRHSSSDAFPLAAEPTAGAVDLVLDAVETSFAREPLIALLRSPHFSFAVDGPEISAAALASLNRFLSKECYLGDRLRLESLSAAGDVGSGLRLPVAIARELAPMADGAPASVQVRRLVAFLRSRFRTLDAETPDPFAARERRARAAVLDVLNDLADAHACHHDPQWTIADLASAVRRWIQEKTFRGEDEPLVDEGQCVRLLNDQAARYAKVDDLFIVGLVENEWPERPRRNIFYPPELLRSLGWPSERDRRAAADAALLDLVASPTRRVILSTFTLDDEMLVTRSMQLDEIARAGLPTTPDLKVGPTDRLSNVDRLRDVGPSFSSGANDWSAMRLARPARELPQFHGETGPQRERAWSVSALETYLECPFKFFARHLLALDEEPEDEEVMDPRRQGQFVHTVFETFFKEWQTAGHGAITARNLNTAREMFAAVVDRLLESIPPAEAALERTRLLGSPAASGLGEAVFRMEAERPIAVIERLLEYRVDGELPLATNGRSRVVHLRGKVDRIDLLADGTFRLIDYKLGWPPDRSRALQLPIYALAAERNLQAYRGRCWTLGEAAYLAFKGPKRVVPLFTSAAYRDEVLASAEQRALDTVEAIERGHFPPAPDDVFRCETCAFAAVCRKDYVAS